MRRGRRIVLDAAHRYFLEVVNTGSVKDAAANLHVAASAVSRQIAKLEEASGAALFDRRPHGMVLTKAGELLAKYARRVAVDTQRMRRELHGLRDAELRSTIRIGSSEAVALNLLPGVLGAFRASHPDVAFQVQILSSASVAQKLADGSIDIGLAFSVRAESDVAVRFKVDAPLRAVMATKHPLALRARVSLNDLKAYPIALTESGTTVRWLFDARSSVGDGAPFNLAYSSDSSSVIYAIVKSTNAVTLAGEITLRETLKRRELVAIPIAEAGFETRVLAVQTAKDRALSAEAERFLEALIGSLQDSSQDSPQDSP